MARIIVFGPHPDDQEIGMGGTIARLADQGHDVLIVDVTDGSPTPKGDRASRLVEAQRALEALQPRSGSSGAGKPQIRRILLDLKNREVEHTLAARHLFAGAIRAHQASVVFAPHWEDAHPDHRAVTRIAEDARFDAKLTKVTMPVPPGFTEIGPPIYPKWFFYYDVSHLRRFAQPDFVLDITGYERQKQAAVLAYRSQFGPFDSQGGFAQGDPKGPPVANQPHPGSPDPGKLVSTDFPERLLAYATYFGSRIGVKFGEGFWSREPLGFAGLDGLVGLT
ncbi:MAG: PIG-L family deacetylase [Planctomycetota bacterium]|nr:PIG-L family deacetylase [Planctomycetota bacterium]